MGVGHVDAVALAVVAAQHLVGEAPLEQPGREPEDRFRTEGPGRGQRGEEEEPVQRRPSPADGRDERGGEGGDAGGDDEDSFSPQHAGDEPQEQQLEGRDDRDAHATSISRA